MLLLSDSINELDEERSWKKQQQLKTNVLSRSYRLLVINMRIYTKTPRLIQTWVQSPERGGTLLFDLNRYVPLGGVWLLES